jgi:acetolactate synthase-1/2/3 large subunit
MFNARVERTVPVVLRKLPYFPAQAAEVLGRYRAVIRVGADLPVAMFAYPSEPHLLAPGELVLAGPADDASVAMELLASALGVTPAHASSAAGPDRPPAPGERLDVFSLAAAIGATLPAGAIVVDEGQTSSLGLWDALAAVPHDLLALTGGAIGGGPPLAVGAALAAPGRRVVNLEGDGSALYSLGAWWTQASRQLDVTTVIAGNGGYTILDLELGRSDLGHLAGGPLTSLRSADLDFVALAAGYGVPGVRVADGPALVAALRDSFASPGPRVIHAVL